MRLSGVKIACIVAQPLPPRGNTERQLGIPLNRDLEILVILDGVKIIVLFIFVLNNQLLLFLAWPLHFPSLNKLIVEVDELERNRHTDEDAVIFFEPYFNLEGRGCACAGGCGGRGVVVGHGRWVEV